MRLKRQVRLWLCLWLAAAGCVAPQEVAASAQVTVAQTQSEELAEAERLHAQVVQLYGEVRYAEAVPLAERALAIREKALGPDHPDVAASLNNLAALYEAKGDYARAEPLYQRALSIDEKALGPGHPSVATSLNNLALLYYAKGDLARAEPLYRRALALYEKALGPDHPSVANSLNNLAELLRVKGDFERAEPLFQRALAVYEKVLGPDHRGVANSLNNLAGLYQAKGDYARAEPLFQRALAVREKALGPGHPDVATSLNNLAELIRVKGELARAEPLYQRSLAIYEKALGPGHPSVATSLNNLALLYKEKGDLARAEPLYQRALALYEKALGPGQPAVATALDNLAGLYWAKGDLARTVQLQSRALEVRERNLSLVIAAGSERQKIAYLATLSAETAATVSLHARSAPSDSQALRLSLTTILRRKGRALDAVSDQVSSLRRRLDPQDRALLDQLSAAQSQLSALTLGGPGNTPPDEHRAAVSRLEERVEQLQDAVSRRSAEFNVRTQPVTTEQVRQALPAGAALVEFYAYRPFDPKAKTRAERFGPARYVTYVLGRQAEPLWVDLGEAAVVDADVARLLTALKCPQTATGIKECPPVAEVKRLARALDERVMRPVRKLLGQTQQVFLSPDGVLNLLPFAALVDESGKYLVESYSLTYLTSGRDLIRLQLGSESRQSPLVFADPLFGRDGAQDAAAPGMAAPGRRSSDLMTVSFVRLPGTAEEAKAIGSLLPGVRLLTQSQATEQALKAVTSPRVLHVATHGFFLPDQPREAAGEKRGLGLGSVGGGQRALTLAENPLLRSGLALAGANVGRSGGGEDGILTALEAAGLDLWGTELVVLSSCETGVGEVKAGEGVYGLRRALVLAGSKSQVMSLWQVSDEATRDLMVSYYKRLLAGEGRTEALRRVQLGMLGAAGQASAAGQRGIGDKLTKKADRSHPYFWAAFIQSGDWRGMGAQPIGTK